MSTHLPIHRVDDRFPHSVDTSGSICYRPTKSGLFQPLVYDPVLQSLSACPLSRQAGEAQGIVEHPLQEEKIDQETDFERDETHG